MSSNEKKNVSKPGKSADGTAGESRRKLLRKLAAGGVAGAALPAAWSKPVIDSVILPAHAQTTGSGEIVGGGGGGGGTGPGPAPSGSLGRDLMDFLVNPAEAGEGSVPEEPTPPPLPPRPQPRYCVEVRVAFDGSAVTEVTVTKYCFDFGGCNPLFLDITNGSVKLKQSGNQWKGKVDDLPMSVSSINLESGGKLADIDWFGIPGVLNKGASCDCSCVSKS